MAFLPGKCLLSEILREKKIEPVTFYTKIGWSKQQYSVYVTGKKKMSIGTLKTVANELELPMDDVYEWIEVSRN
jgi:hypothetical protein